MHEERRRLVEIHSAQKTELSQRVASLRQQVDAAETAREEAEASRLAEAAAKDKATENLAKELGSLKDQLHVKQLEVRFRMIWLYPQAKARGSNQKWSQSARSGVNKPVMQLAGTTLDFVFVFLISFAGMSNRRVGG